MQNWIDYLTANPIIAIALVVVLVLFVLMVFKKLIIWAVISFVILSAASGFSYHAAQKAPKEVRALLKRGAELKKQILKESKKTSEKIVDDAKELIEDKTGE
jgi:UPF0716 family protein affecting phage T7 exclusion